MPSRRTFQSLKPKPSLQMTAQKQRMTLTFFREIACHQMFSLSQKASRHALNRKSPSMTRTVMVPLGVWKQVSHNRRSHCQMCQRPAIWTLTRLWRKYRTKISEIILVRLLRMHRHSDVRIRRLMRSWMSARARGPLQVRNVHGLWSVLRKSVSLGVKPLRSDRYFSMCTIDNRLFLMRLRNAVRVTHLHF